VVPVLSEFLAERPTPITRQVSSGDRHLKFYDTRDYLFLSAIEKKAKKNMAATQANLAGSGSCRDSETPG
jgi:hypothetical protein